MKVISTDKAPGAIGPYSQGYIVGEMVYTSGQIPIDPATGEVIKIAAKTVAKFRLAKAAKDAVLAK